MVCTANRCRSPIAAALLRQALPRRDRQLDVVSAGTHASGGTVPEEGLTLLLSRGIDLSGHEAARLTTQDIAGADLLLGMARQHVREIVASVASAQATSFTLKDFVRRAETSPMRKPGQDWSDWLAELGAYRTPNDLVGASAADDVADPISRSRKVWTDIFTELGDLTHRLSTILTTAVNDR